MSHTHRGRHLSPLQHYVLGNASIGVDIHALVLVTHKQLDAVCVWQNDDGMRLNTGLDLNTRQEIQCESQNMCKCMYRHYYIKYTLH